MYATRAELNAYIEGGVAALGFPDDDEHVTPLLTEASHDVDRYVGPAWPFEEDGFRFGVIAENPKDLTDGQIVNLVRATCAQAEYRIVKGPEFFRNDQHESTSGPDFSTRGKLSRYGPKMREALHYTGLVRAVGGRLVR